MYPGEPAYIVVDINKKIITIEQRIGCYTHTLKINKKQILEVLG